MDAPPYVAMKCSVTSDSGQPTPSPLIIGVFTPAITFRLASSVVNLLHVVGGGSPWAWKKDTRYQNPSLTFPVYPPPPIPLVPGHLSRATRLDLHRPDG